MTLKVASFHKTSFNNFFGDICSAAFISGCNLKCPYCHNPWLLEKTNINLKEEFLRFLKHRQGLITAVTISGGEPTLQPELEQFIKEIKVSTSKARIKIKLDTNGTNPKAIENLIRNKCIDYIAMDIKGPLSFYKEKFGLKKDAICISDSVETIKNSGIQHEFRVTIADPFIGEDEFIDILNLAGDENLILQPYEYSGNILDEKFKDNNKTPSFDYMNKLNILCDGKAYLRAIWSETANHYGSKIK